MGLSEKKCIPCRGGIPPLTLEEAKKYYAQVSKEWKLEEKKISREFKFKDFREAMRFVNKVAEIAESEGHHPDISVHYNKVMLELYTHKINGLHENDFIMAAKIDGLGTEKPA